MTTITEVEQLATTTLPQWHPQIGEPIMWALHYLITADLRAWEPTSSRDDQEIADLAATISDNLVEWADDGEHSFELYTDEGTGLFTPSAEAVALLDAYARAIPGRAERLAHWSGA